MNTETVTVHQKGEDFEIIVQHDQSGSAYGMPLSKNAYEQLRQHFVSGRSEQLVNFLLHLNDKELINNHDFDYEKEVKKYLKKIN
jgi:hypothetical protein